MKKKILTICAMGNSRSVALAFSLKEMKYDAIAMGIEIASDDTQKMLFEWANKIILVDKRFEHKIPEIYKEKLLIWDVGGDRFFRGFEPELMDMYTTYWKMEGEKLDE